MLYYAEASGEDVDGGIQITGSHNPPITTASRWYFRVGRSSAKTSSTLGRLAAAGDWLDGKGTVERARSSTIMSSGCWSASRAFPPTSSPPCASAGTPATAPRAPRSKLLAARLPGEHFTLYTEVDGNFPNHHPDPTVPENLEDLRKLVAEKNLDFGIAFDGDGDRIGAIDGEGRIIWGDQLLMIYAEDLLT